MRHSKAFTIVELLIVIVVIGILAAITVVAYNGIQKRANNTARINEIKAWQKHFELYKAQEGQYPALADDFYCLGSGFPVGGGGVPRCRNYGSTTDGTLESGNTSLMNELKKVGSLPGGIRQPIAGSVGPYTIYSSTSVLLIAIVEGSSYAECPSSMSGYWTDSIQRVFCSVTLAR